MKPLARNTNAGRFYTIGDNDDYVSVTTPLGNLSVKYIKVWEALVGKTKAKIVCNRAGNYGTAIHDFAEKIALGKLKDTKHIAKKYAKDVDALLVWFKENVEEILGEPELTVYSTSLKLAGTIDLVCRLKGRTGVYICDYKTGRMKDEHFLQLAAYVSLIRMCPVPFVLSDTEEIHRLVIAIKGGKITEVPPDKRNPDKDISIEEDWYVYLGVLSLWHWYQTRKSDKPKRAVRKVKNRRHIPKTRGKNKRKKL